ncbi:MAG: hypothetical protein ACI4V6_03230, partial [Dorea sp.]
QAGTYMITAQVSNSAGDVCSIPLEVVVTESGDRQEQAKWYPMLSSYIVYTHVNKKIKPMSYVIGMEIGGVEYTYEEDEDRLSGTKAGISVKSNVDYTTPGVYSIDLSYTAEGAPTAVTRMYVVVEGEQEGEQDGEQ